MSSMPRALSASIHARFHSSVRDVSKGMPSLRAWLPIPKNAHAKNYKREFTDDRHRNVRCCSESKKQKRSKPARSKDRAEASSCPGPESNRHDR